MLAFHRFGFEAADALATASFVRSPAARSVSADPHSVLVAMARLMNRTYRRSHMTHSSVTRILKRKECATSTLR